MVVVIKRPKQMSRTAEVKITVYLLCYAVSLGGLCPEQKLCRCRYFGEEVDLYCIGTGDLVELKENLRENFSNFTIRAVSIKPCNATSLPADFIQNITVMRLFIRCPLLNFSDDALVDSYRLFFDFGLYNHRLTVIPDAFTSAVELRALWITNGTLESVGDQFKNLRKLKTLSLKFNRIRYVSPEAFAYMTSLLEIWLSFNQIKNMDPNTFSSCKAITGFHLNNNHLESAEGLLESMNPKEIHLEYNNLTDIHIFHPGMWRTTELVIRSNPVKYVDNAVFGRYLPSIVKLDLSKMNLSVVSGKAFIALPRLKTLDLSTNQISKIHKNTFHSLTDMKKLFLSHNKLASVKGVFQNQIKLSQLDISFNRIEDLEDSLKEVPNLDVLHVRKNKIRAFTDENFRWNIDLNVLRADANNISTLTKECFKYNYFLKEIQLSFNNLVSLNGSIRNLPNLQVVYLVFNRIEVLENDDFANVPGLGIINLRNNRLTKLSGQFKHLRNLHYLNLQNNRILTLGRDIFPTVVALRTLFLEGNALSCDCRLEWLKKHRVVKDNPLCQAPYWLKGRHFHNVSGSEFVDWKGSCPLTCKCHCQPNGSKLGIAVDCSARKLTKVPETFPRNMTRLNLSDNNITVVSRPESNGTLFDNLQELDIENNQLTAVDGLRPLRYLSILKLANNSLETIAVNESSNYSLVTLSGNPWLCDCSTLWFRSWVLSFKDKIPDINQTRCGKGNVQEELLSSPIIYLSENDICPTKIALYIAISIGILVFLLFVTSSSFTYYRYRLNIKVWLYAHGFSFVKEEEIDKDKPFDAFVSFSSRDDRFVSRILAPTLENKPPRYFLCIHDRNFPAGNCITESIISAVQNSKRTLLVLSKNFLESEWCTLEFRTAHLQALKDKINRVIVIVYGKLPPEKEIDEGLKIYLKSTTYLIWGERYFWQKLIYALPKVRADRERQQLYYDEDTCLLHGY